MTPNTATAEEVNVSTTSEPTISTVRCVPGAPIVVINDGPDAFLSDAEMSAGASATILLPSDTALNDNLSVDVNGITITPITTINQAHLDAGKIIVIIAAAGTLVDNDVLSVTATLSTITETIPVRTANTNAVEFAEATEVANTTGFSDFLEVDLSPTKKSYAGYGDKAKKAKQKTLWCRYRLKKAV